MKAKHFAAELYMAFCSIFIQLDLDDQLLTKYIEKRRAESLVVRFIKKDEGR